MKIIGSDKGIHSPEFHKKKTRERRVKRVLGTLAFIIIIGLPVYFARAERFQIRSIEISGNKVTKSEDIESIVTSHLSGKYLWLFPKSNVLLYPKQRIEREILAKEPRLSAVEVTRPSMHSLKVEVVERKPFAEYCRDISDISAPSECFFLDDTGYIFAPAPAFSGDVYFIYSDTPAREVPVGTQYLDPETFQKLPGFLNTLHSTGLYPKAFHAVDDQYELVLPGGAKILWKSGEDLQVILMNLQSFFSDDYVQKQKDFLERVSYLDLRFGNKIFYKFRE